MKEENIMSTNLRDYEAKDLGSILQPRVAHGEAIPYVEYDSPVFWEFYDWFIAQSQLESLVLGTMPKGYTALMQNTISRSVDAKELVNDGQGHPNRGRICGWMFYQSTTENLEIGRGIGRRYAMLHFNVCDVLADLHVEDYVFITSVPIKIFPEDLFYLDLFKYTILPLYDYSKLSQVASVRSMGIARAISEEIHKSTYFKAWRAKNCSVVQG